MRKIMQVLAKEFNIYSYRGLRTRIEYLQNVRDLYAKGIFKSFTRKDAFELEMLQWYEDQLHKGKKYYNIVKTALAGLKIKLKRFVK